ncbi:YolD-like family protein [Oceanobacillus alkalisoli]|uniref:YolD-like family protein n=1 Tax=Oceanobacillus alkalisoli TaxID=2925113 RepID=UPI001F122064|nr:YolD-like family protein [Oceanobacillus alkalisoli]MCF3941539.1 YolD-like family protein [Oceanobacillus alkalisoli]
MINNRGSIKWTTMMLPEHAELLRELWNEDNKIKNPLLDPQEMELMEQHLQTAYLDKLRTEFTIYSPSALQTVTGTITKLEQQTKQIHIKKEDGTRLPLPLQLIVNITIKK